VLGRVDTVEPASEHRDRSTTSGKRRVVRHGVDSARQTAHYDYPRSGKPARDLFRRLTPIRSRTARTDHRYGRFIVARKLSLCEKNCWGVWHTFQERRIRGVDHSDQFNAGRSNSIPELHRITLFPQLDQRAARASIQACVHERASISVPSGPGVTEHLDESPQTSRTDAFDLSKQRPENTVIERAWIPETGDQTARL
jgi:hypothetical protein